MKLDEPVIAVNTTSAVIAELHRTGQNPARLISMDLSAGLNDMQLNDLPSPLRGSKVGSFAYNTVKDRWPVIVTKLVDLFSTKMREFVTTYGPEAEQDSKEMLAYLSKLRYRLMTDKRLEPLHDSYVDVNIWNDRIAKSDCAIGDDEMSSWFTEEWLFAECYLYRQIYGVSYETKAMKNYDYFSEQKQMSFNIYKEQIMDLLQELYSHLNVSSTSETDDIHLSALIKHSLWGNRCDLSFNANAEENDEVASIHMDLYIVNDLPNVLDFFKKMRHEGPTPRRIDIVLDNVGLELVSDMVLAEFLLARNMVDEVKFHLKAIPWFVSDATIRDWDWTIASLKQINSEYGPEFAQSLEKRVKQGTIKIDSDLFWTSYHRYCDMEKVAPGLYEDLKKSSFIIFKGDLNYRKLVGDREWKYNAPIHTAIQEFRPAPMLALRTLKAEVLAGLNEETARYFMLKINTYWLTSGEHAIIQMID